MNRISPTISALRQKLSGARHGGKFFSSEEVEGLLGELRTIQSGAVALEDAVAGRKRRNGGDTACGATDRHDLLPAGRRAVITQLDDISAGRIAQAIRPLIAAELAKRKPPKAKLAANSERAILELCTQLGEAVDRLEAARGKPGEIKARVNLERSAQRLRTFMRKREKRHAAR